MSGKPGRRRLVLAVAHQFTQSNTEIRYDDNSKPQASRKQASSQAFREQAIPRWGHAEGKHAEGKDLESKLAETDPIELKLARVQQQVQDLFATKPDWMTFYREIMGLHGLMRRAFPSLGRDGRI